MRFSFSQLSMFNQCNLKWKFRYIDKLPQKFNIALVKGSLIHGYIETLSDNLDILNILKISKNIDILNTLKNNPNLDTLENLEISEKFDNFIDSLNLDTDFKKQCFNIALKFCTSDYGYSIVSKNGINEYKIKLNENLEPCTENEKFVGFIDRVNTYFINNSSTLETSNTLDNSKNLDISKNANKIQCVELIDYKTGKYKEPKYQDFTQLIIYAIYVFQKFSKIQELKLRFVYVEHNLENSLILTREYLETHKNNIKENMSLIESTTEFKPNFGVLCNWCDYQKECKSLNS